MMTRRILSGQSLEDTLRRQSSQRLIRCLLSVVGIVSLGGEAAVGDEFWDQWRGPSRDGFVAATAKPWPDGLDQTRLEERWRIALGPSYSGPVLAGNIILVTETRDKKTEHVRALDRMTGRELWQASWEGAMKVPFFAASNGSWIRATPCIDGDRVYVAGMRDVLVCLDLATGREVWRVNFVEAVKSPLPAFGFVSSPLVVGDYVFVQAAAGFVKLEKATGNIVWRVLEDGGGMWGSAFSSPYPTVLGGVPQILVQTRELLAGVDPENGTVLWKTPVEAFRGMNIVTPTVSGGRVFTTSYGGGSWLFAIDLNRTEEPVEQVWRNKIQGYMSSPIVIDGHAYVHLRNQRFACLDLATGKESWITTPFGRYWSLIAQADRMLALDETGDLRLIRANPERYELIGEAKVAAEESWAHLAVVGDEVYVRDLTGLTSLRWK
ncbi:MAG: PQQ-binding-like beta-propeller repeat protein [Planctomycetota bacterium]|nr:PQQ-binding-like beta-propeller repeat protein [Planctomycetota bacterium]